MRTVIEKHLLKHWYGAHRPPWYLRMLEPAYRATYQRAQTRQKKTCKANLASVPLIVVGNITVGGTGKTPLVIALSQLIVEMHLKAGIATTGYGRKSCATLVVQPGSDTQLCGDEPVMLARRCGVPVVVAARRSDAVMKLQAMGVDLVISDDGLQQADLRHDIDICVVDGERGLGNGHLLPAGPLRESAERLVQVDWVVTNGHWTGKPNDITVSVMSLQAASVHSLDDMTSCTLTEFRGRYAATRVHAVAAIGNPDRFFSMLEQHGIDVIPHSFADHHRYSKPDFASMSDATAIIMTEKDAVKCRGLGLKNAWYVPVDAVLPDEFKRRFKERLASLTKDR